MILYDAQYHSHRAMQELDLGLKAESFAAAKAHLRLSALHMERARVQAESDRSFIAKLNEELITA